MSPDFVRLPPAHLSIRVPWHDNRWQGTVCSKPADNSACLILSNIREKRRDAEEEELAGRHFSDLTNTQLPPCARERVSFMSEKPFTVRIQHPYWREDGPHSHLRRTPLLMPAYSAPCVPFRWMLQESAADLAEEYDISFRPEVEEEIEQELGWKTTWVQDADNQTALLKSFFSAAVPEESLCFFYAKQVPFVEDSRRVLIGAGRVKKVDGPIKYEEDRPGPLNSMIWENRVHHSVRPDFSDGFLLPYHEALEAQAEDPSIDPAELAAFAPDDHWLEFSYASEHVGHDAAIASLLSAEQALQKAKQLLELPAAETQLRWIDARMSELWKLRGPCPGLGAALTAFGIERGTMLVHRLSSKLGDNEDPWPLIEKVFDDPRSVDPGLEAVMQFSLRRKWKKLPDERRALLKLISRFDLTIDQATRMYQPTERATAGIDITDAELIANPYAMFELDRGSLDVIPFSIVDRGTFPIDLIRETHPMPEPSKVTDPLDDRRVRAILVDELEDSARQDGHTLLARDTVIQRVRDRPTEPSCPIDADGLDAIGSGLRPLIESVSLRGGAPAFQLNRLAAAGEQIRRKIRKRAKAARHDLNIDWRGVVDARFGVLPSDDVEHKLEERARQEKTAALEELASARVSVLIGPAGTGKTELLALLCQLPEIKRSGVLLLAPTGKARVQMQQRLAGGSDSIEAQTIAQFLLPRGRYHGETGAYTTSDQPPADTWRTIIIDESSMLTEEMLQALLDGIAGVDRIILVGDPRQLPPIGSGRPFVDIVNELRPDDIQTGLFPKVGKCYAELITYRRYAAGQKEVPSEPADQPDLLLAEWFSGEETSPGSDEIWSRLGSGEDLGRLRFLRWRDTDELNTQLLDVLCEELGLDSSDDVPGFARSLGGAPYEGSRRLFFWAGRDGTGGAGLAADDWQILSPVRGQPQGTGAINRLIQKQFKAPVLEEARQLWQRKIPKPFGDEEIVYGEKVICVRNQRRSWNVYPSDAALEYVANGEVGVVVGQYKTKKMKKLPWKLEVEFSSQPGTSYGFSRGEFKESASAPLELAYAVTVHKAQGSEFGRTILVIPEPCFVLSRELLYTALTRQRERVVILYQGSVEQLRQFATPEKSETAGRLTNLFSEPSPVQVAGGSFLEAGLIHQTRRGELVRSKSEVIIADLLFSKGIDYAYESPLVGADGTTRYPDFTLTDDDLGVTIYWEHLGLAHDPGYARRWARKERWYEDSGIKRIDLEDPRVGENPSRLLVTEDDVHGGIQSNEIEQLLDALIG